MGQGQEVHARKLIQMSMAQVYTQSQQNDYKVSILVLHVCLSVSHRLGFVLL